MAFEWIVASNLPSSCCGAIGKTKSIGVQLLETGPPAQKQPLKPHRKKNSTKTARKNQPEKKTCNRPCNRILGDTCMPDGFKLNTVA